MGNATEPDFQEFVSWKVKDQAAYTPAISEVRDEIIDTWRGRQARKLASDAAAAIAEKIRKGGEEPWKSVLSTEQQPLLLSSSTIHLDEPTSRNVLPQRKSLLCKASTVSAMNSCNVFLRRQLVKQPWPPTQA